MADLPHADQPGLFDGMGPTLAAEGIDSVLEHAGDNWQRDTFALVIPWLKLHAEYCADDLWRYGLMPYEPHHPNAIGALTRRLIERGYLANPPLRYIKSRRDQAQARKIPVYTSRVFNR